MTTWNPQTRFRAILDGTQPDRTPVSAWRHFVEDEHGAENLANAHIDFAKKWDLDWVKLNPRSWYYAEAWGKEYDPSDYRGVIPRAVTQPISKPKDLGKIGRLPVGTNLAFLEHIEAAKLVRTGLPELPVLQTVFSPLSTILELAGLAGFPPEHQYGGVYGADAPVPLAELLQERSLLHQALHNVADTLADYVRAVLATGVDGIFYAVLGTAEDGLFTEAEFAELSRPYDEIVLRAAEGHIRLLHTCSANSHPERFADYPVDAINWDQQADGNPWLDAEIGKIPVGGVSHELITAGTPTDIERATLQARAYANERPVLLTPGCAVPVPYPDENLAAFFEAARR
ncbi:MAG: hypothetical protein LBR21_08015 [Propionibacteriaceae bacterium]|jgi:uroporphyrinogen decarboxylase|nr:hypothetical protein [Propionibacteriaceae bacterium]